MSVVNQADLDKPCPSCGKTSGDHTLREWAGCLDSVPLALDEPYKRAEQAVRERFHVDDDVLIADSVVVKASVLNGWSGIVAIKVPCLLHEFSVTVPGEETPPIAKVLFIGTPESLGQYSALVMNAMLGAVAASGEDHNGSPSSN